jgi:hypothetical protein
MQIDEGEEECFPNERRERVSTYVIISLERKMPSTKPPPSF